MRKTNLIKVFAYSFLSLLTLLALVVAIALSPLGVSILVNIANDRLGLNISGHSGSFYSSVNVEKLEFEHPQITLVGSQFNIDIGLNCVFLGKACLENLSANTIDLIYTPSTDEPLPSEPLSDYVNLPFALVIDALKVKQFNLYTQHSNTERLVVTNTTQASSPNDNHKVLSVTDFVLRLKAKEQINLSTLSATKIHYYPEQILDQNMPKQASSSFQALLTQVSQFEYTPVLIPDVFVPLNVEANSLRVGNICVQSARPLCIADTQAKLSIQKQVVKASIKGNLQQQAVRNAQIIMQLDLANRFTHKLTASLTPNKQLTHISATPLNVNAVGNLEQTQMVISTQDENGLQRILELNAGLNIGSALLPADIQVQGKQLSKWVNAWLPDTDLPLNKFDISVVGDTQNYQLNSQFDLLGKQSSMINFSADLSLQDKVLSVKRIASQGEIGTLQGTAKIVLREFSESTQAKQRLLVDANIDFSRFRAHVISPDMSSDLSGKLIVKADYLSAASAPVGSAQSNNNNLGGALSGSLVCQNISGRLQGYNLALNCDAHVNKKGLVTIKSFELLQGEARKKSNSISGKGTLVLPKGLNEEVKLVDLNTGFSNTQSDFALTVNLQDLSYLYPELLGSVAGSVSVLGTVKQPAVKAILNVDNLQLNATLLKRATVELNVNVADNWNTDLTIKASDLTVDQQIAQTINLSLKGDMQAHLLNVELSHPQYSLRHTLNGMLALNVNSTGQTSGQKWRWQGQWQQGEWRLPFDTFSLKDVVDIDVQADAIGISAHCWGVSNNTNDGLCISDVAYKEDKLNTRAKLNYDLQPVLRYYLPDIIQVQTFIPLNSEMYISYGEKNGISANAYNLITQGRLVTTRHDISLMALVANLELKDDVLFSHVFAGTQSFGSLGLRSELVLDPNKRKHEGQFSINKVQLSPLLRFLPPVEKIAGIVNGSLDFAGPLEHPLVNGEIDIGDGELVVDRYPYPISNFNQSLVITNNVAKLMGEFELGSGSGEYLADIEFADGLGIVGTLKGIGMQLAYNDHELLATPDLAFDVSPDNIQLSGTIAIPNAQFTLDTLPDSAKAPSSDTLIIGQVAPEPIIPAGLDVDLRLIIDKPKLKRVNIDAFDLEASLAGDLRLIVKQEKNLQTGDISPLQTKLNGTINILQGRYEAYGQVLQIRRGDIHFTGPPSLPQFDISAIRNPLNTANQVIAGVRISGNPIIPKVELFSEPAMIQARQLSYLLQGTDLGSQNDSGTDVLLLNMLVGFGVGGSENRVNKLGKSLGFDSLNIRTAGQGTDTQFQVTGRIAENIQVTYGVGLFDSASEVILKYQLLPQLYVEAKSGANSALDLFYEVSRGE